MRALSTWMYFDREQVTVDPLFGRRRGRGEEQDPGIGVAWFAGEMSDQGPFGRVDFLRPIPDIEAEALSEELVKSYVDLLLMGASEFEFGRARERSLKNQSVVDYVMEQPIVIERSPPFHVTLKGLITATNLPVWIGSYMGWTVAPEHSVLLFITVPGGIIVVSSATGLASALGAGLSKTVKRFFSAK